jgi:hypothetical protein
LALGAALDAQLFINLAKVEEFFFRDSVKTERLQRNNVHEKGGYSSSKIRQ